MKIAALSLTLLHLLVSARAQCDLACQNGECQLDAKDYSNHPKYSNGDDFAIFLEKDINGQSCKCDDDDKWTGVLCERPVITCNDGKHHCYHGGQCVETPEAEEVFETGGYLCDCRDAHYQGVRYIGQFCEIPLEGNECEHPGLDACVNGGECVPSGTPGVVSCKNCNEGWEGKHCELRKDDTPSCDLDCENEGVCRLGFKNLPVDHEYTKDFFEENKNSQYCECTEGFFGNICKHTSMECGDKHCFNGALCIEFEESNGDLKFYCNCTAAMNENAAYAGRHCQYESKEFCTVAEDQNGYRFCVNEGECPTTGLNECSCPPGFSGPRCEISEKENSEEDKEYQKCDTECVNGSCAKGVKSHGTLMNAKEELSHIISKTTNENFEHCICGQGWAGLHCETKMELCENGRDFCFNGGKCVPEGDKYGCDCSTSDVKAVGRYCQHHQTDGASKMCSVNEGFPTGSFCTEHGQCKLEVDALDNTISICQCDQGWQGKHCEGHVENGPYPTPNPTPFPTPNPTNAPPVAAPTPSPTNRKTNPSPGNTQATNNGDDDHNQAVIVSCVVVAVLGLLLIAGLVVRTEYAKSSTHDPELEHSLNGSVDDHHTTNIAAGSPVV